MLLSRAIEELFFTNLHAAGRFGWLPPCSTRRGPGAFDLKGLKVRVEQ